MNLNTVNEFRHEVYSCFHRAADALFNTVDALATETTAHRVAHLSLSPFFERQWPSLYEAFEDGCIDRESLQRVLIAHLPPPPQGEWLLLGLDASNIARPESATSADRLHLYVHNLPESRTPPVTVTEPSVDATTGADGLSGTASSGMVTTYSSSSVASPHAPVSDWARTDTASVVPADPSSHTPVQAPSSARASRSAPVPGRNEASTGLTASRKMAGVHGLQGDSPVPRG